MKTQKRVLITGAGSGLGRALAQRFASDGYRVAVADIDDDRAQETVDLISMSGRVAEAFHLDVRKESDFADLAAHLEKNWGGIDVLINNAGVSSAGRLDETSTEDWQWMLDINLMGVVQGCRHFIPLLTQSAQTGNQAHIVNIASFAAIAQLPGMATYNVAKTAVVSLSETLRAELLDQNIGVSVACPSFFKTNLLDSFRGPDDGVKKLVGKFMERSAITADDVADQIFAAVQKNRFLVITHGESRQHWRIKRASPELYFRIMTQAARKMLKPRAR